MESSHVFYRQLTRHHPRLVRGEGVYLWDAEGRKYLDACGGAAVVNIGHGVKEIADAMAAQAAKVAYGHGTVFTSESLEKYSDELARIVPLADPRFYFLSGGAEAVETGLKFARQLHVARGDGARHLFISCWGSYHGATLATLAIGGKASMRDMFAPLFREQVHIAPPYCYRCAYGATFPLCNLACAQALETEILHQGPERVAAFIGESVGGATLGAIVPPRGYWELVAEICERFGVLLIMDEVMSGFGRTGRWFAAEWSGVRPHMMAMGKGASGGYYPLSIAAVRGEDVDCISEVHQDFIHGGTFSHHIVGAAVGLRTLRYMEEHQLLKAVQERGAYLEQRLRELRERLQSVGDVRGLGLLWAVEFVADRKSKAPFPAQNRIARNICDEAFRRGAIFYPGRGSVDGVAGDHLLIAPPYIITEEQIDEALAVLAESIQAVCPDAK